MSILTHKLARRSVFSALTALLLAGLVALQLFLFGFLREAQLYFDMTPEGLYTMTDLMKQELRSVSEPVTVSFCMEPDRCMADDDLRPIYLMAKQLEDEKANIRVENLNLRHDSHAADAYKPFPSTEIAENDVIVSYGPKHRVARSDAFYTLGEDNERWSFKGEYQLANMILSVVRVNAPVAYFTVGHGEAYFDTENVDHADNAALTSFYYSLLDLGMSVKTLSLDAEAALPDDCVLLIMNGPERDYADGVGSSLLSTSATEKLDRYLRNGGSLLYLRDPEVKTTALPVLSEFLAEWGIAYRDDTVKEDRSEGGLREELSVTYATSETGSLAYAFYQAIADLTTAPRTLLSNTSSLYCPWVDMTDRRPLDNVRRESSPLFFSSETTARYTEDGLLLEDGGVYALGLIGMEEVLRPGDATYRYSYVMALGSTSFLGEGYFGSTSYGNRDVMTALLRVLTRTDSYASTDLGSSTDMNSLNYGGKVYLDEDFVAEKTYLYLNTETGKVIRTTSEINSTGKYAYIRTLHPMENGENVFLVILLFALPITLAVAMGVYVTLRRRHL